MPRQKKETLSYSVFLLRNFAMLISLIYAIILTVASTLRYKCESYPDFRVGNDILIKKSVNF